MKKVLSILLSFVLVLCLVPLTALPVMAQTQAAPGGDEINADFVNSVVVDPQRQKVQKGKSFTFTADVSGSITTVRWVVTGQKNTDTRIDSNTGKLTVASNETAEELIVKATSTFDSSKYDTAIVYPVDYPVYIQGITISPTAVSLPKGSDYRFTASVSGTDFDDVTWSLPCDHADGTTIDSSGLLEISGDEYFQTLTVRVTSDRDPSKSADAIVTVTDAMPIGDLIWVNYDVNNVGLSPYVTGRQVTEALTLAIDYADVALGTYIFQGSDWTCLVKDLQVDSNGTISCTKLGESDELLDPSEDYYYLFNVENRSGYIWNLNNLPSAKVNGENADYVRWRYESETGDVNVYKKAYFGSGDFVTSVTVTPYAQMIKKGTSFTYTANVVGSVNTVSWSISGNKSSGTYINSSTGKLTVASDETASYISVIATSTFDNSRFGTAGAVPVDYNVYISGVTISPTSATVPKGGTQTFEVTVEGTDYHDYVLTVEGNNSIYTTISQSGYLSVSEDETATTLIVKATSVRNSSKSATATVTVTEPLKIGSEVWVKYDTGSVGLTTSLTGRQVTQALAAAIDYDDVAEGTYVFEGSDWTCLVKDVQVDGSGVVTCTELGESDELLNTTDEYYFLFNVENKAGYRWDIDDLPSAKVNGAPADYVCWRYQSDTGDINVFKRVYLDGTNPSQVEVSPKTLTKTLNQGYGPYALYEPITFTNTGTEPLRLQNDDDYAIHCSNPLFDTLAGGMPLYLQPGESYTRDLVIDTDLSPGVYTTDVTFQDVEYKADPVSCHVTVTVEGIVNSIDIINMPDAYAGNKASNYNYSAIGVDGDGYHITDLQWCTYDSEIGYLNFNGTFEMNKTYYLAVEMETDEYWHFNRTNSNGLAVYYFTRNGSSLSPKFYGSPSEYFNGSNWLKFYMAFPVTQEGGVNVTAYPGSAFTEGVDYKIEGTVVSVKYDQPCKVGYYSGGKYVPCTLAYTSGQWHMFEVPSGVDEVILVVKGDADLSGEFDFFDVVTAKAMDLHPDDSYTQVQLFAADVDDDGEFGFFDVILSKAADLGKTPFTW
ncbi:MAG: hypothetical protein IJJ48_03240 [Firmicutes bacterium]|nr:hypothetical protein [Bacillota bacterium]